MKNSPRKPHPTNTTRAAAGRRHGAGGKLISQIDLLRMRVAAAASTWKRAKEQASQAKRRRKLAKLLAKRAKKDARTAKDNLDELRQALAATQAREANPWQAAAPSFSRKSKPAISSTRRLRGVGKPAARVSVSARRNAEKALNPPSGAASPPQAAFGEVPATG